MELLLIRHAQTHSNVVGALDTAVPGADLTDLGREQVRALGETLREEVVDAVWCSPTARTRATVVAVTQSRGLQPQVRDGLVEIGAGDYEMSVVQAHAEEYREMVVAWVAGDLDRHLPGGEDGHTAIGRFDAVLEEVVAADVACAAVVAHGGILRTWCGVRVGNVPLELVRDHPLPNTGVVRLSGTTGSWRAVSWDGVEL